jgi:Zinc carboxypeptidase
MRVIICLSFFIFYTGTSIAQLTPYEKENKNVSATYDEIISWYETLDKKSNQLSFIEKGMTDAEKPLHLVLISSDQNFNPKQWHQQNKITILINNGIHAGEPDGIDASMMLARDIVNNKIKLPVNVCLAIIPIYNIGGCLNRNSTTRVNQNGPKEYGFRGNSQNLDLNRDFTKCDSKEAKSFSEIFQWLQPDIFIDNHVSDGADYQHTMTLLTTQYDKLGSSLGHYLRETFEPSIYKKMSEKGWDLVPYVDFESTNFDEGMDAFYDPPRYSSGYAALFNTLSFVPETHMLKSYDQRVQSTYDLMVSFIEAAHIHRKEILAERKKAIEEKSSQKEFALKWKLQKDSFSTIIFNGYERDSALSEATGLQKYFYNHQKPFTKKIKYYNHYEPVGIVKKPKAYIIPQGWHDVIERMKSSGVLIKKLNKDSTFLVTTYKILSYESYPKPYEKHHKNFNVKTESVISTIKFSKGDYYIDLNQFAERYIIEMLEPTGDDSFFAWNFFDGILQQKEGYSDYRWEDLAAEYLKKDTSLQAALAEKKKESPEFAKDAHQILDFIYKHSPYYEKVNMRYPVYRVEF